MTYRIAFAACILLLVSAIVATPQANQNPSAAGPLGFIGANVYRVGAAVYNRAIIFAIGSPAQPYPSLDSRDELYASQFNMWMPDGTAMVARLGYKNNSPRFMDLYNYDLATAKEVSATNSWCHSSDETKNRVCKGEFFWPEGSFTFLKQKLDPPPSQGPPDEEEIYSISSDLSSTNRPDPVLRSDFKHQGCVHDLGVTQYGGVYHFASALYNAGRCQQRGVAHGSLVISIALGDAKGLNGTEYWIKTDAASDALNQLGTTWSPDGHWLAFIVGPAETPTNDPSKWPVVWIVDAKDLVPRKPEGQVLSVNAKRLVGPIAPGFVEETLGRHSLTWSDDSKWLYYAAVPKVGAQVPNITDPIQCAQIFRVSPLNPKPQQLTDGAGWKYFPAPSPDGGWFAYVKYDGTHRNLYTNRVSTQGGAIALTNLPDGWGVDWDISWRGPSVKTPRRLTTQSR